MSNERRVILARMNKAVAAILTVGGIAAAITGAIALLGRDEEKPKIPLQGMVKNTTRRGGMTSKYIYKKNMSLDQRVKILQDLTWKSVQDPRMRKLALAATRHCPERDGQCEAKAVYSTIKERIRYTGDIAPLKLGGNGEVDTVDLYQSAYRTWEFGGGDCDDHAVLAATLLSLNGIDAQFRIIAASPDRREEDWSHIYVRAGLPKGEPKRYLALDTTLPGSNNFAVEPRFGKARDFVA